MQLKSSVVKGGLHLSIGHAAVQASSFVRNIILARLISPADFGVAAVFGTTLQLVEMLSNVAAETLLVQAEDGDEPRLQATAQLFRAVRGAINGLIIIVLAGPIAGLFGVPQATWAFRCLALFPAVRGLYHMDMNRLQRHMRFVPVVTADAGSSWLATVVAVPLALILLDYRAMLFVLVLQVSTATVISQFLAERRYRWAMDKGYWRRILEFGWPLMVNGLLMFGIFEGDRLIIGSAKRLFPSSAFTLSDLGVYSVMFALTMAPTVFVANISSSLFLPLLSRVQNEADQFKRRYFACSQAVCLAAALISIVFITAGGRLVSFIYGSKYATGGVVIAWLAAMWAVRIIRVAPTLAAMAMGDTKNTMISNSVRSIALAGMVASAALGANLVWIAISGFSGELLALAASIWRLHRAKNIAPGLCLKPLAVAAAGMGLSSLVAWQPTTGLAMTIGSCLVCTSLTLIAMVSIFPGFREDLRSMVLRARSSAPAEV